jgi:hypothetical protein
MPGDIGNACFQVNKRLAGFLAVFTLVTRCFARGQIDRSCSRKVFSLLLLPDHQGERQGDG